MEAAMQNDAAERVKAQEAKREGIIRRLKASYPDSIVDTVIQCRGLLSEAKLADVLCEGYLKLWNRLSVEEKDNFFSEATL
jgi:hypothetical protein